MCSPLTALRWVGGSGARAQGPFAPGGQWITLLVNRVKAVQHHDWRYRERDPGERAPGPPAQPPGRSPHSRQRTNRRTRAPAWIAGRTAMTATDQTLDNSASGHLGLTSNAYDRFAASTPAASRMAAAIAIMAPLSVHRSSSG